MFFSWLSFFGNLKHTRKGNKGLLWVAETGAPNFRKPPHVSMKHPGLVAQQPHSDEGIFVGLVTLKGNLEQNEKWYHWATLNPKP